ncbi:cell wall assembly/cell proliferation coordinating protein, KNR4-like protein [Alcanivorax xiamenensis]|uniref:Cell wall assembly/cell proliferation coordinating protein, KNR4-like protein n=1 Tax=Alcanivorax xiamenensis TaxID=1177156 RepID=A0ABQ6Y4B3_9GAMM|nr:cell wall assembly/cell proliferation coordinating protein, KNR4-like protein [Alcanivorax xiamenensis]
MKECNEAIALIQKNPDVGTFVGPPEERLIELAEKALGQVFPPSYRRFTLELGAGNFGAVEIYGVIDDDFENSSIPDGV